MATVVRGTTRFVESADVDTSVQQLFRPIALLSESLESSVVDDMSDKVLSVPKNSDSTKTDAPEQPKVPFNSADWQAANAKHQDGKGQTTGVCDCKIEGKLDEKETAKAVEELSKATTPTARMAALGKLADGGVEKFSMKDKDGTTRQFRIETEKAGGSTLLHCYGMDERNQEQVVMRAARSADGKFTQQRYQDDHLASFHGDTWSRNMAGKSFLVGEVSSKQLSQKNIERRSTADSDRSTNDGRSKSLAAHDSNGKNRRSESRDRHRDEDDRRDRKGDKHSTKDREGNDRRDDRHTNRDRERHDRRDDRAKDRERSGSRFNLGEALGTVGRFVAPFLFSALERSFYSNDCNLYRYQQNQRFDRGCRDYYDSDRYGYDRNRYDGYDRGQDFRRQDHCRNDYDRRYGNYERYGHNNRNHHRHDNHNRRSSNSSNNWLSKLFR